MSDNKPLLPTEIYQFAKDFLISGISAQLCKTIVVPFQLIQARIFYQDLFIERGLQDQRYKGHFDCFKTILIKEGPLAFWKSQFVSLKAQFANESLNFALNDAFKRIFNQKYEDGFFNWFVANMISGGLAGFVSLTFLFQFDTIRTKMQLYLHQFNQGHQKQYKNFIDAYKKTLIEGGITSLYQGFTMTSIGHIIYRSIYFGMYESSKPFIPQNLKDIFLVNFGVGSAVALLSNLVSVPVGIVKQTMIMNKVPRLTYKNSFQCFLEIIVKRGVLSLFQGLDGLFLKSLTAGGTISCYDWIQKKLK